MFSMNFKINLSFLVHIHLGLESLLDQVCHLIELLKEFVLLDFRLVVLVFNDVSNGLHEVSYFWDCITQIMN